MLPIGKVPSDLERGKPNAQLGKALAVLSALGCRLDLTPPALTPVRRV